MCTVNASVEHLPSLSARVNQGIMAESSSCLAVTGAVFEFRLRSTGRLGSSESSLVGGENFDNQILAFWHLTYGPRCISPLPHWRRERTKPVCDSRWSFVDLLLRMCCFSPWSLLRACGKGNGVLRSLSSQPKQATRMLWQTLPARIVHDTEV